MLINEVCRKCKLTKKAVEYYEEQQLVQPRILENGYRDFSESDVMRLQKIAILRQLGLSIPDIQAVLNDKSKTALYNVSSKKALEIEGLKAKQKLAQKLANNQDWEYTRLQLETLEKKQSVLERLIDVFPGYYGKYISLHFAPYLNEPVVTEEQQEAFEKIITFLDNVDFDIPADLREYLDEVTRNIDENSAAAISENMDKAVHNIDEYIADNKETLEQYLAFKKSDEYKKSPAYRLEEVLKKFNSASGYNDVFIPAMKQLSKSYCEYHTAMEKADKVFIEKYPADIKSRN